MIATAEAVKQWRYEPPADPPISFDLTIAFGPNAEPSLVSHGGMVFRPAAPPPPPPPPPPPAPPDALDAAPWAQGAVRVDRGIRPPANIRHVAPAYPPEASGARVQGTIIIEVRIEPDGRIQHARVIRSIPLLDQAALDAVLSCPAFELPFPLECGFACLDSFLIYKRHWPTASREFRCASIVVFQQPTIDVACFADVQRVVRTPKDVDVPHRADDDAIVEGFNQHGVWVCGRPFDSVAPLPRSGHSP